MIGDIIARRVERIRKHIQGLRKRRKEDSRHLTQIGNITIISTGANQSTANKDNLDTREKKEYNVPVFVP